MQPSGSPDFLWLFPYMLPLFYYLGILSCVFAISDQKSLRTRYLMYVQEELRYLCLGKKGLEDGSSLKSQLPLLRQ